MQSTEVHRNCLKTQQPNAMMSKSFDP